MAVTGIPVRENEAEVRLSDTRVKRAAIAAVAVGALFLLVGGYVTFRDTPRDTAEAGTPGSRGSGLSGLADLPTDSATSEPTTSSGAGNTKKGDSELIARATSGNPFANSAGSASLHKIVMRASSDGAINVGYRYRDKKGDGQQVVQSSLTVSRSVRGPLPIGQLAVQVLATATYATCTITIDGVEVRSYTVRGRGRVIVCTD